MSDVTTAMSCRSRSARTFDGCDACIDLALEATEQAVLYMLARAVPALEGEITGPTRYACRLAVRLCDEAGDELGRDEVETEQTVAAVETVEVGSPAGVPGDALEVARSEEPAPSSTMRLDDFQTVLDRLELAPVGASLDGIVEGQLFAFERLVGRFDIVVKPR